MQVLTKPGFGYTLGAKPKKVIPLIDHTHEWDDCPDVLGPCGVVTPELYRRMRLNRSLGPDPIFIDIKKC